MVQNVFSNSIIRLTAIIFLFLITDLVWSGGISRVKLNISHTELDRIYKNEIIPTKYTSITGVGTEKLSDNLKGSLIFGYQEQLQGENSIAAARYAVGYFGGLSVDYTIFKRNNFESSLLAKYQYHQLEGKEADQAVKITWYDITFGVENYYSLNNNIQLLADVYSFKESGEERALEPLSQLIHFENKSSITYSLGIAYNLNSGGSFGVKWLNGAEQGFQLIFSGKI
ncbi:MAG: hypothetical protein ACC653_11370 [Gammaproteobacteria bacterium]